MNVACREKIRSLRILQPFCTFLTVLFFLQGSLIHSVFRQHERDRILLRFR